MKKTINLFRKNADAPTNNKPVYNQLLRLQQKAADCLNRKTAKWSPGRTKIVLFVFCLLAGNGCLWLISKAFTQANGPPAFTTIQKGTIPSVIPLDSSKLKLYEHLK